MKRTCKKLLALVLAAVLLCGATGCVGKIYSAQGAQAIYNAAKAAVDAGDYEKAYTLLLHLDTQTASKEALELKEKLVCVPVRVNLELDNSQMDCTYQYDEKGNVVSMYSPYSNQYNGECKCTWTYDAHNRLTTRVTIVDDSAPATTTYTYDAAGNCIREEYVNFGGSTSVVTYTYDAAGNKTGQETIPADGSTEKLFFTYDGDGNLIAEGYVENNKTVVQSTSTYDADGNLLRHVNNFEYGTIEMVYSYNDQGKALTYKQIMDGKQINTTKNTYDDEGHLLKAVTTNSDGDGYTEIFDVRGKCVEMEDHYSNGEVNTTQYTYDAYGNRLSDGDDTYEYTYDHLGNILTLVCNGEELFQAEWKLFYYPDGVPDEIMSITSMWNFW